MRILLTGATGFLGSHILCRLVEKGAAVTVLTRRSSDLRRIKHLSGRFEAIVIEDVVLKEIFNEHKFDLIIHCATDYGRKQCDPADILETNLIFPLRLLHLGVRAGIKGFINTDTILEKGVSHYSLSKNQFREWLSVYSHEIYCVNVALEHFYGPADDPTKFVSFLINNLVNKVDKIDLTMGEQKRNFIYIDDVVEAFMKIVESVSGLTRGYSHFEIASGDCISIREFACLAKKLFGSEVTKLNFGAIPYRENEVMEVSVDTRAIKNLGWRAVTSLEEGLLKTIDSAKGDKDS